MTIVMIIYLAESPYKVRSAWIWQMLHMSDAALKLLVEHTQGIDLIQNHVQLLPGDTQYTILTLAEKVADTEITKAANVNIAIVNGRAQACGVYYIDGQRR